MTDSHSPQIDVPWQQFILENYPPAKQWQDVDSLYSTKQLLDILEANLGELLLFSEVDAYLNEKRYLTRMVDDRRMWAVG